MCPGCRAGRRDNDSDHAREYISPDSIRTREIKFNDRNPNCRHYGKGIDIWIPTCPGCKYPRKPKGAGGPTGHNYKFKECRWAPESFTPRGRDPKAVTGAARKGKHPRDPRIPAAAEPTADLPAQDAAGELGKDDEEHATTMGTPPPQ